MLKQTHMSHNIFNLRAKQNQLDGVYLIPLKSLFGLHRVLHGDQ